MAENARLDIKTRSHTITAEIDLPQGGGDGVIIAQGGRFGGWTLYMKDGKLKYCYKWLNQDRYTIQSKNVGASGKAIVELEFKYDGSGVGKGGTGTLYVNHQEVGEGRIDKAQPIRPIRRRRRRRPRPGNSRDRGLQGGRQQIQGTVENIVLKVVPPPAEVEKAEERQEAAIDGGIN